ncbi:MAG: flagellar motor switch protein FliN [Candidatus Zixiibacteriota bacterium]|nr:MAG: flagellar motor switch protein FliN [candidate division Zixibacteria bacterium]
MADENEVKAAAESEAAEEVDQQATPPENAPAQEAAAAATPPEGEGAAEQASPPPQEAEGAGEPAPSPPEEAATPASEEAESEAAEDVMAMLKDVPEEQQQADVDDINFAEPSVSKAEFQQLSEPAGEAGGRNIELLMDVNLPISIELGRTRMSIADILALGPGSVVELNKLAGEPVDLLVNQKVVARGEVVVIDENFGVRITQLMTAEERLKSLGEEY